MIRVDFIDDGIFAVPMMLLVLDLCVPVSEAIHSEQPLWVSGAMQHEQETCASHSSSSCNSTM